MAATVWFLNVTIERVSTRRTGNVHVPVDEGIRLKVVDGEPRMPQVRNPHHREWLRKGLHGQCTVSTERPPFE
jgi:hypothetical protein